MSPISLSLSPFSLPERFRRPVPGLLLAAVIGGAALSMRQLPMLDRFSPLILAIVLGMALGAAIGRPAPAVPGLVLAQKKLLRIAVALLGLQITLGQIAALGLGGFVAVAATLFLTLAFTIWLGGRLGVPRSLAMLIGAGTAICGASAVMASRAVAGGDEEDAAYAVGCVTLFGTLAMLALPSLSALIGLSPEQGGMWAGAAIHEVAQAVAAAFQGGEVAGSTGTVAKLTRVLLLVPTVFFLGWLAMRARGGAKAAEGAPFPWFLVGFLVLVLVNSAGILPAAVKGVLVQANAMLMTLAMAAIGLSTDFGRIRAAGPKPLLLGFAAWVFISVVGLGLILTLA